MKNNGFSTIELLLSFVIISIITIAMFKTVTVLNEKLFYFQNSSRLVLTRGKFANAVKEDLMNNKLTFISNCGSNCYDIVYETGKVRRLQRDVDEGLIKYGYITEKLPKDAYFSGDIVVTNENFNLETGKYNGILKIKVPISTEAIRGEYDIDIIHQYIKGDERLLGYWKFDGNSNDSSGNNNHGTIVGSTSYVLGKFSNAIHFNNARIETPIIDQERDFSFSVWFRKTDTTWGSIAIMGTRRVDTGWMLYRNSGDSTGYFRWYMHYQNDSGTISNYYAWPHFSNLEVNDWYHIVNTRSVDGKSQLYLNGNLIDSLDTPSNFVKWLYYDDIYSGDIYISIGSGQGAGSTAWQSTGMDLDDVRFYNRVLTSDEVKALYNLGIY